MNVHPQLALNSSIISVNIPNTPQVSGRLLVANENKIQNDLFLKQFLHLDSSEQEQQEKEKEKLQNRNYSKRVVFSNISLPLLKRNRSRLFNKYYFEELQSTYDQFTNQDKWEIKEIDFTNLHNTNFQKNKTEEQLQQQQQQQQQQNEERLQYQQELNEHNSNSLKIAPRSKQQTEEFIAQKQREANTINLGYDPMNLAPDSPSFLQETKFNSINDNTNMKHDNSSHPNNQTQDYENYKQKNIQKNDFKESAINWEPPSILIPWETINFALDKSFISSNQNNSNSTQQIHSSKQNVNYPSNANKNQKNEKAKNNKGLFTDVLFDLELLETFLELIGTGSTEISRESDSYKLLETQKNLVLDLLQFKEFMNEQYDTLFRTSLFPSFVKPHKVYSPVCHSIGSNSQKKSIESVEQLQSLKEMGSRQSEDLALQQGKNEQHPSEKQVTHELQQSKPRQLAKNKRKREFAPGKRFKLFDLNEDDSDNSDESENENYNNMAQGNDNVENYTTTTTTTNTQNKVSFANGNKNMIDLEEDNDYKKRIITDFPYNRPKIQKSFQPNKTDRNHLSTSYRNLNRGSINERDGFYSKEKFKYTTTPKKYSSMHYQNENEDENENYHYPQRKNYSTSHEKKSPYNKSEFMNNRTPKFSSNFSSSTPKDRKWNKRDNIYKPYPNRNLKTNHNPNLSKGNNYYSSHEKQSYFNTNYKNPNYSNNRTYSSSATTTKVKAKTSDNNYIGNNNDSESKHFEGRNEEWKTYKRYDEIKYPKNDYQERSFPNEKKYRPHLNSHTNSNAPPYKDISTFRNYEDSNTNYHPSRNKPKNYSRHDKYKNDNHFERSRNYSDYYQNDRYSKSDHNRRTNSYETWETDKRRSRK
ncbi:hypothetical protein M0812_29741 [Anaeramoeba flamelloides]|uniref:Uncharacterized protein n=1 Tax=Anaeramoeba flamelloides TaxID=1746091 RepID=A0AAV7Y3L0_9EUKA|nr:hypothetical protein M0812_29741 [Anaeramoeba flamelloides]